MVLVAAAMLCYGAGTWVMLPHSSRAAGVYLPGPAVTPPPASRVTLAPIPQLVRDPFLSGKAVAQGTTQAALMLGSDGAFVPGIETSACKLEVEGTYQGTDARTGKPLLIAHVSVNEKPAQRVSVGDFLCGDVVTGIGFDGITVGDHHYGVVHGTQAYGTRGATAAPGAAATPGVMSTGATPQPSAATSLAPAPEVPSPPPFVVVPAGSPAPPLSLPTRSGS